MREVIAPYQLLPDLTPDEYASLRASIAANGYDPAHPVVVDETGTILDGHHRARACAELGVDYPTVVRHDLDEAGKRLYALRANLGRRHLSSAQKRELIARLLADDPTRSDRAIARLVGCDHKTVATVRRDLWPNDPAVALRRLLDRLARIRANVTTLRDYLNSDPGTRTLICTDVALCRRGDFPHPHHLDWGLAAPLLIGWAELDYEATLQLFDVLAVDTWPGTAESLRREAETAYATYEPVDLHGEPLRVPIRALEVVYYVAAEWENHCLAATGSPA